MAYLSLYRRWRSQSFAEVVGQSHIVRALQNSLNSGRISHAYLFTGPRGTGKTTLARLFAKGLNCAEGTTADFCGECSECVEVTQGNSLNVIEIDGASNRGIDEIRDLREQVRYAPVNGRYKVYIIDEVHMLTTDAFNALLKTLEEPPQPVVFILATTDPQKIPSTILSRCQRYDFKRFKVEDIKSHLNYVLSKEEVQIEGNVLEIIAQHADGSMRDALGIVDQCLAYSQRLNVETVSTVLGVATRDRIITFIQLLDQRNGAKLFQQIEGLYYDGKNLRQFVCDLLAFFREAVVSETILPELGISWNSDRLLEVMAIFSECEREMRYVNDTNIPLELAVLKLIQPDGEDLRSKVEMLANKLEKLERTGVKSAATSDRRHEQKPVESVRLNPTSDSQAKLTLIQENWQKYLEALRNERLLQPEAFLREGTPMGLEGNQLVIGFPQGRGFHKTSMEQDQHKEPAERVLTKMFGSSLTIKCIISEVKPTETKPTQSKQPQQLQQQSTTQEEKPKEPKSEEHDETVNAALRIFGGKVINIKDK